MLTLLPQSSFFALKNINAWIPLITGFRGALYPAWHQNPISDLKMLEKLDSEGKLEALKVIPVKPAPCNLTNSLYDDPVVNKFTNIAMMWSNKTLIRKLIHDTFARIKRIQLAKYHAASEEDKASIVLNPKEIFTQAINNCKPVLELVPIKKGGITYQVPIPVAPNKSQFMAMKWIINAARDKEGEISFVHQLTKELLDAFNNEGRVVKGSRIFIKYARTTKLMLIIVGLDLQTSILPVFSVQSSIEK